MPIRFNIFEYLSDTRTGPFNLDLSDFRNAAQTYVLRQWTGTETSSA